jgi:hypothetical protein
VIFTHIIQMPKAKRANPSNLPDWANEPLKFAFNPDEALRRCATIRLPTSRKKSVKTRLKSR